MRGERQRETVNGLYPIIRRKRRPLIVADAPPTVVADVEPVQTNAERGTVNAEEAQVKVEATDNGTSGATPEARCVENVE